ncbi:hypothetical protein E4U59_004588 [Claviceps monticola]|nr:hypothetical protein E4U59_004588 [Claviceps monticola]
MHIRILQVPSRTLLYGMSLLLIMHSFSQGRAQIIHNGNFVLQRQPAYLLQPPTRLLGQLFIGRATLSSVTLTNPASRSQCSVMHSLGPIASPGPGHLDDQREPFYKRGPFEGGLVQADEGHVGFVELDPATRAEQIKGAAEDGGGRVEADERVPQVDVVAVAVAGHGLS